MIFNRDGKMSHADRQWARALMRDIQRVACMTKDHGVTRRIDLVLRLYQAYAVSLGMYASQIWSTAFLHADNIFSSEVQSRHLGQPYWWKSLGSGTS